MSQPNWKIVTWLRKSASNVRNHSIRADFDYLHPLIDDHPRSVDSKIHPDAKGVTCTAFLDRWIDCRRENASGSRNPWGLPSVVRSG